MNITIEILFSNYGPYHLARIEGLANYNQNLQNQVVALELARYQDEYPWQIKVDNLHLSLISVIQEQALEKTSIFKLVQKLNFILKKVNPSVIAIAGYFQPAMLFTLAWYLWHRKPTILLSETTENNSPRSWWREALKSIIVTKYILYDEDKFRWNVGLRFQKTQIQKKLCKLVAVCLLQQEQRLLFPIGLIIFAT